MSGLEKDTCFSKLDGLYAMMLIESDAHVKECEALYNDAYQYQYEEDYNIRELGDADLSQSFLHMYQEYVSGRFYEKRGAAEVLEGEKRAMDAFFDPQQGIARFYIANLYEDLYMPDRADKVLEDFTYEHVSKFCQRNNLPYITEEAFDKLREKTQVLIEDYEYRLQEWQQQKKPDGVIQNTMKPK